MELLSKLTLMYEPLSSQKEIPNSLEGEERKNLVCLFCVFKIRNLPLDLHIYGVCGLLLLFFAFSFVVVFFVCLCFDVSGGSATSTEALSKLCCTILNWN